MAVPCSCALAPMRILVGQAQPHSRQRRGLACLDHVGLQQREQTLKEFGESQLCICCVLSLGEVQLIAGE